VAPFIPASKFAYFTVKDLQLLRNFIQGIGVRFFFSQIQQHFSIFKVTGQLFKTINLTGQQRSFF
jgi:hypothetical protein